MSIQQENRWISKANRDSKSSYHLLSRPDCTDVQANLGMHCCDSVSDEAIRYVNRSSSKPSYAAALAPSRIRDCYGSRVDLLKTEVVDYFQIKLEISN